MKNKIPQTIDEAIEFLYQNLDDKDIKFIKKNSPESAHFFGGMKLRNEWGLWDEECPIKKDCYKRFKLWGMADDLSGLILAGLWAKVRNKDAQLTLAKTALQYFKHWKNMNVNPLTREEL